MKKPILNGVTLKQLRGLRVVAQTGSIAAAAERLSLSPPAIHSQIKKLEDMVGVPILTRDADDKLLIPTASGETLITAVERMEGVLSWACDNLDALGSGMAGHVRLGFESTGRYFAPRLVRLLAERCPSIAVSFRVANRLTICDLLETHRIDLAIMGRPPRQPISEATPIAPHPYSIILRPDHPLARKSDYDPEALLREPILAREPGSGTRILLDRYLNQLEAYGAPHMIELDSNETIREAVIAGLGVAMLSLHVVHRELAERRLATLSWPRLPIMRYWYLVASDTRHLPESAARIRQAIQDENGRYIPGAEPAS